MVLEERKKVPLIKGEQCLVEVSNEKAEAETKLVNTLKAEVEVVLSVNKKDEARVAEKDLNSEVLGEVRLARLDELEERFQEKVIRNVKKNLLEETQDTKEEDQNYVAKEVEEKLTQTEDTEEGVREGGNVRIPRLVDEKMKEKVNMVEKERHELSPLEADKLLPPDQEVWSRAEDQSAPRS